jgi:PAS domain S-box-containing protein
VRKDGTRFWADVVISAVRGPDGRLVGYSKVTRDLTETREANELLRQSEQRSRLVLESVSDYAIYMLDPAGNVLTWNKAAERLKGYSGVEILGRNVSRFYTEADRASGKPEQELRIAAEDGRYEDEGWRVRKDGTEFWASVVLSAIRDGSGKLLGFAKVTRDLTDRRLAEEERLSLLHAQESLRMRDEFLSIAAHELRTPLTALQIGLQSLTRRSRDLEETVAHRISRATRSAERLSHLVESLLDVARISTGRFELKPTPLELGETLREVVDRLQDAAAQARCPVSLEVAGKIEGSWDRLRLEQIVMNLLGNAFKYASGTPVRIAAREEDGQAVLEIEDRGPGIPEEHLERIFSRFERAASIHQYGGLGLGLYVSLELTRAHGGTLDARNLSGGGIRFELTLPLSPPVPDAK